jgi:hypothetical protein
MDTPTARHLSPAPRAVPLALSGRVLLGSVFCHLGWGLMLFGMIFVWAFDAGGAIREAFQFAGNLAAAEGVSVSWRQTNMSVNDTPVYETTYSFRSADGYDFTGASYRTGGYIETGQSVTIEYVPSDPSISRIQGMRASIAGLAVIFVYIFPIVGLAFAMLGVRKGIRRRYLLSTGELALAKLVSKEPTNTRVNNQTVYKYTFEFEVPNSGVYQVVGKTYRTGVLDDEEFERVVYDPRDPNEATLLDELPCRPAIDNRGDFDTEGAGQVALAGANLVLPSLTLAVYVAYALYT